MIQGWLRTCPGVDDDLQPRPLSPRHGEHDGTLQQDRPRETRQQRV